jgi:hypothetical protein
MTSVRFALFGLLLTGCSVGTHVTTGSEYVQVLGYKTKIPAGYDVPNSTPEDNRLLLTSIGATAVGDVYRYISIDRKTSTSINSWIDVGRQQADKNTPERPFSFDGEPGVFIVTNSGRLDARTLMGGVEHLGNAYQFFVSVEDDPASVEKILLDISSLAAEWHWTATP